jgi:hypothetical protein
MTAAVRVRHLIEAARREIRLGIRILNELDARGSGQAIDPDRSNLASSLNYLLNRLDSILPLHGRSPEQQEVAQEPIERDETSHPPAELIPEDVRW